MKPAGEARFPAQQTISDLLPANGKGGKDKAMKHLQKRLTAMLTAGAALLAAIPFPASAADGDPLPEWIPTDYSGAVRFLNSYGATHAENGYICAVFKEVPSEDHSYLAWCGANEHFAEIGNTVTEYEIPEDPGDPEQKDKDYWQKLDDYETYLRARAQLGEEVFQKLPKYRIYVVQALSASESELQINWAQAASGENPARPSITYSFAYDGETITETDKLGWLPDCWTEYRAYQKENGVISIHGDWIVVCKEVNYSTGAELVFGVNGKPLELMAQSSIEEVELLPQYRVGDASRSILLYAPTEAGISEITLFVGIPWSKEYGERTEFTAEAEADAEGRLTLKALERVPGDLNADGALTVADIILLQKFLLGIEEFNEAQLMIAELTGDAKVNAADLTVLKRLLLNPSGQDPIVIDDPVNPFDPIIIIDDPITDPIIIDDPVIPVVPEGTGDTAEA